MYNFNIQLTNQELYTYHNQITLFIVFIWIVVCILGYYLKNNTYKNKITIFLILLSLIQEIFDYYNRFYLNDLYIVNIQTDLPLQLCHFGYWFSVLCLIIQVFNKDSKYKQFYFGNWNKKGCHLILENKSATKT